mgnify:CR=1 FL=1
MATCSLSGKAHDICRPAKHSWLVLNFATFQKLEKGGEKTVQEMESNNATKKTIFNEVRSMFYHNIIGTEGISFSV